MAEYTIEQQIDVSNRSSVLKEYYARYLIHVRGLKESSVKHYYDALNNISRRLVEKGLVSEDVYEIADLEYLQKVRAILYSDPEFIELNERGKRMYSAGLNNYYRFASGEEFQKTADSLIKLDMPFEAEKPIEIKQTVWKRSNILRTQALSFANYQCEINKKHESFIAEATGENYMEGHHAIPMKLQEKFQNSLDVYANIVCLCPMCHRKIHYGVKVDRMYMLNQIYEERADRLAQSGIKLSKNEFAEIIL